MTELYIEVVPKEFIDSQEERVKDLFTLFADRNLNQLSVFISGNEFSVQINGVEDGKLLTRIRSFDLDFLDEFKKWVYKAKFVANHCSECKNYLVYIRQNW